jgi:alpha-glucosidase
MRKYLLLSMFLCLVSLLHAQNKFELVSPNGEIKVSFNLSDKIYYNIDYNGEVLLKDNFLQLILKNQVLGQNPKLRRQKRTSIDEQLTPVVPLKYSKVNNRYNQLLLTFKDYSVEFRAFDDGIAYRFITSQKGDVEVMGEEFAINFPSDYLLHLQQPGGFKTSCEEPYTHIQSNTWKPEDKMAILPALIDTKKRLQDINQ